MRLGAAVLRAYEDYKRATARLDYDDLIQKTGALLTRDNVPWVLFKLDGGLSHLLIERGAGYQRRTTPHRRRIDRRVLFRRRRATHTSFVVGDAKQSIYSFQGADPEGYRAWRDSLSQTAESGGTTIRPVPMEVSFRSSFSAVLDAVDATFAQTAPPALVSWGRTNRLCAITPSLKKAQLRGRVEAWTPTCTRRCGGDRPLRPRRTPTGTPGGRRHTDSGRGIGRDGPGLELNSGTLLESEGRPISGGRYPVPAAETHRVDRCAGPRTETAGHPRRRGSTRIALTEQIAVMDLLALARALLLPQDESDPGLCAEIALRRFRRRRSVPDRP